MVDIRATIDSGFSAAVMTFVASRNGVSLGTTAATVSQIAGLVTLASATINMTGYGAGVVNLVLVVNATGTIVWDSQVQIDAAGELVATNTNNLNILLNDISTDLASLENKAAFGFTVLPSVRSNGSKIDISTFVGEQQSPLIPLTIDLTEEELEVVWEPPTKRNTTEIAVLTTEELIVTEDSIQFRLPIEVYTSIRQLKYSLRRVDETSESDTPDKIVIFQGIWTIMSTSLKR